VYLYKENEHWFGVPRGFYNKTKKQDHEELVMASGGGAMSAFDSKMRFEGPYAEQGNAMLQIAEGAAQTIQRIIERQKELITQKLNGTSSAATTTTIESEIEKLSTEVARIANVTTFQGTTVFTSLTFQVAETSANGTVTVAATLTISDVSLAGTATLQDADDAMDSINSVLANIGAGQNVLDYTTQNLKSTVVNLRAAESTIRDVDMAEEMATFTRNNILSQAAQAMLSQANQGSQGVLSLLR
jgi:flagellin